MQLTLPLDRPPLRIPISLGRVPVDRLPLPRGVVMERCTWLASATPVSEAHARIGSVELHANRRLSLSLTPTRTSADRPTLLALRSHWALLLEPESTRRLLEHACRHGRFPDWTPTLLGTLSRRADVLAVSPPRRRMALEPRGVHVDLAPLLASSAARLPEMAGTELPTIGWGRHPGRRRRHQIRLGSARLGDRAIVIHPVLDDPSVPAWVTGKVVHHELCHFAAPPLTVEQSRELGEPRVHHSVFRSFEARYPDLFAAREWIAEHLNELLTR